CPPPAEIYSLALHDALPIFHGRDGNSGSGKEVDHFLKPYVRSKQLFEVLIQKGIADGKIGINALPSLFHCRNGLLQRITFQLEQDRKSTRLNSSHVKISYAV